MSRTIRRRRVVRARGKEYKRRDRRHDNRRRRHQEAHGPRRARGQWAERLVAEDTI